MRLASILLTIFLVACRRDERATTEQPETPASPTATAPASDSAPLTAAQIDRRIERAWHDAGIEPAPGVDDAGFLRRAYLDLVGVVPPPDVVRAFLDDRSTTKRGALVERLLASPGYAEHWSRLWENLLLGPPAKKPGVDREEFRRWIQSRIEHDTPYDAFVRDLVTASGRNTSHDADREGVNGAVNWILRFRDAPEDLAGTTSRLFLGVQIQCAQCHDHKTEHWKQKDFRRFTACFLQMRSKPLAKGAVKEFEVRDVAVSSFLRQGKRKTKGSPYASAKPAGLDGTSFANADNRRTALAAWMTDAKNPWFAKAFVNRMWGHLLGQALVEPVDDLRPDNPGPVPDLLDALGREFVASGYDVKQLVRVVTATQAYQRASRALAAPNAKETALWARYPLKALGPDELLDSIVAATDAEPLLERVGGDRFEKLRADLRTRMTFLFEVDEQPDAGEFSGTIAQALWLLNGRLVNGSSSAIRASALDTILALRGGDGPKIEALYLRTLSRRPGPIEITKWKAFVKDRREVASDDGDAPPPPPSGKGVPVSDRRLARTDKLQRKHQTPRQQAYEDVFWALLNSSEFTFNH